MRSLWVSFLSAPALALALAFATPAAADLKPGDTEKEKEKEKVPDSQGKGSDLDPEKKDEAHHAENPLPKIVEMIRAVEDKLVEADTGAWTQDEQERIVKALEGQAGVVKALEELIKEAESHGGGSCSGGDGCQAGSESSGGEASGQDQKKGQPQSRGEDEKKQPVNPQGKPEGGQERNDRTSENNDRKAADRKPNDPYRLDSSRRTGTSQDRWGNLPPKVRRALMDADAGRTPEEWREKVEDYLKKINDKASPGSR